MDGLHRALKTAGRALGLTLLLADVGLALGQPAVDPPAGVRLIALPPPPEAVVPSAAPTSLAAPPVRLQRDPESLRKDAIEINPLPVPLPPLSTTPTNPSPPRVAPGPELHASTPPVVAKGVRLVQGRIDPRETFDVVLDRPTILLLRAAPRRVQSSNPHLLEAELISPRELSLTGQCLGTTVLHLWVADPADGNRDLLVSYLIRIRPGTSTLDQAMDRLQEQLNAAFPNSAIRLTQVGEQIVVSGQAQDQAESEGIVQLVRTNAPAAPAAMPIARVDLFVRGLDRATRAENGRVVNLLRVAK